MALEVGSVFARLGARLDDTGFVRYEERIKRARLESDRPIEAKGGMRYDPRGHEQFVSGTKRATAETGNFEKATHGAEGRLSKYAIGMRETGLALVGGGAAFGLVEGLRLAIDRTGELQKTQQQTQAALRSTGGAAGVTAGHVEELAKRLGNMAGQDHEAVQAGENILLTFRNIRNEAGKGNDVFDQSTRAVQNLATAMHMDMSSAALQVGKALNDPEKGMTRLQRIGVTFTKQQIAQAKAMQEAGNRAGAQKIILGELNKEFGGSAAAAGKTLPAALTRLKVSVLDAFGKLGEKAAPAIAAAAKGLNSLIKSFSNGNSGASKFAGVIKGAFAVIGSVVRGVATFVDTALHRNAGTIAALGTTLGKLAADVKRLLGGIVGAFRSTFGQGSSTGRDLQNIITVVLKFASTVAKVVDSIVRRALPGIITAFRGLAQIIKGVVEIISGILTLNFGKAWDGVKKIFSGAIKVVGGLLRAGTASFRELMARGMSAIGSAVSSGLDDVVHFFSRLPGRIGSALAGLPGLLLGLGKRAVGAFGSALSGLPNAIGGILKGGGQFLGDIGRNIADWLNAHTPLGDDVKIGPLHVHLPALAGGGKPGNVGPSHGGARVFIAGEGTADEWVISQEGDRRKNVAWAREALEHLTGRRVELHKAGKGAKRKRTGALPPILDTSGTKRHVGAGEGGIKDFDRDITRMERKYSLDERSYGEDDTDFVIENPDGTSSLDSGAIENRLGDLRSLHGERAGIRDKYLDYKKRVEALQVTYTAAIKRLSGAIKAARGAKRKKERQGYLTLRQSYSTRLTELHDVARDLDLDVDEQNLDLTDLEKEATSLDPQHRGGLLPAVGPAAAATPESYYGADADAIAAAQRELSLDTVGMGQQPGDVADDNATLAGLFTNAINNALAGGATNDIIASLTGTLAGYQTNDSGSGSGGGSTPSSSGGTVSAEDLSAAALAQSDALNSSRADLFGSYGGNFAAAGGAGPFAGEYGLAAGARYFGGGGAYGGKGGAGAPQVTQIIQFAGPQPADPHTFAQTTMHELSAAL